MFRTLIGLVNSFIPGKFRNERGISGIYNCFKIDLWDGSVNMSSNTVKCALMATAHTFTATAATWAHVSANQITSTVGYTASGSALTITLQTATAGTVGWDAVDLSWTSATFSAYHAIVWNVTSSSSLVCSIDFGGEQAVTAGTFTIQWSTAGIISMT